MAIAKQASTSLPPIAGGRRPVAASGLVGLVTGVLLIALTAGSGSSLRVFFDLPSLLIVLGGTASVVLASFSIDDIRLSLVTAARALRAPAQDLRPPARLALELADAARHRGLLTLQSRLKELADRPLLQKGLSLAIDGFGDTEIEQLLRREQLSRYHDRGVVRAVLRKCVDCPPAMGLIGTLIGLVQMLGRLDDPAAIGPSMAVALLTTFYGAVASNLVFAPFAARVDQAEASQLATEAIYIAAALSIARQENPRRLEIIVNSILPAAQRLQFFD